MCHILEFAKSVNFLRSIGPNHRQFSKRLKNEGISHVLPYHPGVRWGIVLKRFFEI